MLDLVRNLEDPFSHNEAHLFLQVNDQLVEIPDFAPNIKGVLWEMWALDKVKTVRQLFKALQN